MNRTILGMMIRSIFMDAADDKGGGGGGETKVDAATARTFVSEFVSDPESVKTMPDDKVVEYHGKLKSKLDGLTKAEVERASKASADEVTARKTKWEKGELKIELPKDSKLSKEDADEIVAKARERGLSQEQAVELLNERNTAAARVETRQQEALKSSRVKWTEEIKKDPEMGGDKFAETQRLAMRPVERFMSPKLREQMRLTGVGDYPEFVRFLRDVGAAMAEDKPGGGGGGSSGEKKDAATVLYGEDKK